MKIFLKIVLCVLPLILVINLYRYFTMASEYEYFGITGFVDYLGTADMWSSTAKTIDTLSAQAQVFINAYDNMDILNILSSLFTMVGAVFMIPVMILVDVITNIVWFVKLLTGAQ